MHAVVALCRCSNTKKLYGIRLEQQGDEWACTWAFPIQEKTARNEKYGETKITGTIITSDEYPGCPYCGASGFFRCVCGKLNCWDGVNYTVDCMWCNDTCTLGGKLQNLDITSDF